MSRHSIVHVEIPAQDQQATGAFYAELFGWQVQHVPELNYSFFSVDGGTGGGFPQADGELAVAGKPLIYVDTDDIRASLTRAEELGGRLIVPRTQIPGIGWFGIFEDPNGNQIALFNDAETDEGEADTGAGAAQA